MCWAASAWLWLQTPGALWPAALQLQDWQAGENAQLLWQSSALAALRLATLQSYQRRHPAQPTEIIEATPKIYIFKRRPYRDCLK